MPIELRPPPRLHCASGSEPGYRPHPGGLPGVPRRLGLLEGRMHLRWSRKATLVSQFLSLACVKPNGWLQDGPCTAALPCLTCSSPDKLLISRYLKADITRRKG